MKTKGPVVAILMAVLVLALLNLPARSGSATQLTVAQASQLPKPEDQR